MQQSTSPATSAVPTAGRQPPGPSSGGRARGRGPSLSSHPRQQPQPTALHQGTGLPHGHVPAYLPGSASLVEQLDKKLMIVLRDGKHLVGTLTSYDQFSNLILQDAVERRIVVADSGEKKDSGKHPPSHSRLVCYYADIPLGLYLVRGDSMVLTGELKTAVGAQQAALPPPQSLIPMEQVSLEELEALTPAPGAVTALQWDFDTDLIV